MIRRLNDVIRALLIHAHLPAQFWVEALHTATYLHNILPIPRLNHQTPAENLFRRKPTYTHIRTFGCACYPNLSAKQPHKLSPRSEQCIFLGYPPDFWGYRCYNPTTGRFHISHHVTFDETTYPFQEIPKTTSYNFLDDTPPNLPPFYPFPTPSPEPQTTTPTPNPTPAQPETPPPPPPTQTETAPPPQLTQTATHPTHANTHTMQTRAKTGITKPNPRYSLATLPAISPIPKTPSHALSDPNWLRAMNDEFSAIQENRTWELVPRPDNGPIIRCMWLFRHKFKSDGILERYKARLVSNGKSQTV